MLNHLAYLCAVIMIGCSPQTGGSKSAGPEVMKAMSRQDLSVLQTAYEQKMIKATEVSEHDEFWTAEVILPKIHTWLTPKLGLRTAKSVYGEYVIYELKPIPAKVLNDLDQVLLDQRYSLAILTKKFWHEVAEAQQKGLRIGFLSSRSEANVSGVYFNQYKMVGLSVLAEPGTLPHEIRHSEQFKSVDLSYEPQHLSESCLADMSRATGEIDATTFELPLYLGIENEFGDVASRHKNPLLLKIPQLTLFMISLGYPSNVSLKVSKNESCPEDILQAMHDLNMYFGNRQTEISDLLAEISGSGIRRFRLEALYEKERCAQVSSDRCQRYGAEIKEYQNKNLNQKYEFEKIMKEEIAQRRSKIAQILENLGADSKKDLCHRAIGFSNFVSCGDYK